MTWELAVATVCHNTWMKCILQTLQIVIYVILCEMKPCFGPILPPHHDSLFQQRGHIHSESLFCNSQLSEEHVSTDERIDKIRGIRFWWIGQFGSGSSFELVFSSHHWQTRLEMWPATAKPLVLNTLQAVKSFTHQPYLPLSVVVVLVLWWRAGAPPGMTEGATCIFTGA